jgi:hypothetical protein
MPTTPNTISTLPTAPSRADPANFATRSDAFLGALAAFGAQINDAGAATYLNAVEANSSALEAIATATAITSTSTTSLTIGTGSRSLTVESGRAYVSGMPVRIGQTGANVNVNFMDGTVTTYNATTGALVVNVTATGGSGTLSTWSIRVTGMASVLSDLFVPQALFARSVRETMTSPAISAGTLTLDCSAGSVFNVTLNANVTTLSITNPPVAGYSYTMLLQLTADGTSRTVTWPASVKWPAGVSPLLTSTNSKADIFTLTTYNAGTTWYAATVGQNY